jgi:Gpi18-like mannosyltransferase
MTRADNRTNQPGFLQNDVIFYPVCAFLMVLAVLLRGAGLPLVSHDMQHDLLNWFDYIVRHGRFAALADPFYNYTPPYIYLMSAVSVLDHLVDRVTLIKSISIAFDGLAAVAVYKIVLLVRNERRIAGFSALLFLNLPTLILNGAVWGQFDIVYTTFILGFAYFMIAGRPYWAVLMYGFAFTVKLQAIFLAPFLVYLTLAGDIPVLATVLVPLVYVVLMIPAALAGRSWSDLLTLYSGQVGFMHGLSAHAPNIYLYFQDGLSEVQKSAATYAGVILAGVASLVVFVFNFRARPSTSPAFVVLSCTLWLGLEPSLLPRMHERYFLPADMMAFVFACLVPRAWWLAVLFQVGSALAYAQFLGGSFDNPFDMTYWDRFGAAAMVAAMAGVIALYRPLVETTAPWLRAWPRLVLR